MYKEGRVGGVKGYYPFKQIKADHEPTSCNNIQQFKLTIQVELN